MKKINRTWKSLLFSMLVVPLMITSAFAAVPVPTFYMDMDVNTAGIQDTIVLSGPVSLTTALGMLIPDSASLGDVFAFDLALNWENTEMSFVSRSLKSIAKQDGSTQASAGCGATVGSTMNSCAWFSQDAPFVSGNYTLMTINWNVNNPVTDSFFDVFPEMKQGNSVQVGQFTVDGDGIYTMDTFNSINPNLQGGKINIAAAPPVVPEPISSALFIVGGVVLGARRLLKKK